MAPSAASGKEWNNVGDFIIDKVKEGARGILVGERHDENAGIRSLTADFTRLKEAGVTTLYAEYIPFDQQDMLDAALTGDRKSQLELRALMENSWAVGDNGASTITAQARYEMMIAAHDAGLRVIGVYTSREDFSGDVDWSTRMTKGDEVTASLIHKHDDGKPFVLVAGNLHALKGNEHNHWHEKNGISPDGLHSRLTKAGIPIVSLTLNMDNKDGAIVTSIDQKTSDFSWNVPRHEEGYPAINKSLNKIGGMHGLGNILSYKASLEAETDPQAAGQLRVMRKDLNYINNAYSTCQVTPAMVEDMSSLAGQIMQALPSSPSIPRRRLTPEQLYRSDEGNTFHRLASSATAGLTKEDALTDNGACSPETARQTYTPYEKGTFKPGF